MRLFKQIIDPYVDSSSLNAKPSTERNENENFAADKEKMAVAVTKVVIQASTVMMHLAIAKGQAAVKMILLKIMITTRLEIAQVVVIKNKISTA